MSKYQNIFECFNESVREAKEHYRGCLAVAGLLGSLLRDYIQPENALQFSYVLEEAPQTKTVILAITLQLPNNLLIPIRLHVGRAGDQAIIKIDGNDEKFAIQYKPTAPFNTGNLSPVLEATCRELARLAQRYAWESVERIT